MESEESYLINKAKLAQATDPSAAKAWILAAKTLYPNNFAVQFEAYCLEKSARNAEEAAKCLSYIILTFHNPPEQLWQEIAQLTDALRTPVDTALPAAVTSPAVASSPAAAAANAQSPSLLPPPPPPQSALTAPNGANSAAAAAAATSAVITPAATNGASVGPTAVASAAEQTVNVYVQMFAHLGTDVQQQILQLTASRSDNNLLEHSRLILLLMRRFPLTRPTHAPRLLDALVQGVNAAPTAAAARPFRDLLLAEALPLLHDAPPAVGAVPPAIVHRIMACAFEHHIGRMFGADADAAQRPELGWPRLLGTLDQCGGWLQWAPLPAYERTSAASMDRYWLAVYRLMSGGVSDSKQLLFGATVVFVMALQAYMRPTDRPTAAGAVAPVGFVLVEGVREAPGADSGTAAVATVGATTPSSVAAAQIVTIGEPCTPETAVCLVTAANCWQLLHSTDSLQLDFGQLLRTVPLAEWIARFLIDLAFYVGSAEEARAVLADSAIGSLERNVRVLSLVASQPNPNVPLLFECMLKTLADASATCPGHWLTGMAETGGGPGRRLVLLPLSRRAIVQYCAAIVVRELKLKLRTDPARCSDSLLGNLLVLLQLDWPAEHALAEQVFDVIAARGSFTYLPFGQYVVCIDLMEQFMSMWYPHGGEVHLVFSAPSPGGGGVGSGAVVPPGAAPARRIGTRGADKGVRDDFKLVMRQQVLKCNADVAQCVERFMIEEQGQLMQNIFEK